MPFDARELLERGAPTPLRDVDMNAVVARGRRWRRRRTSTAVVALAAVAALAIVPLPRMLIPRRDVVLDQPSTPLLGTWVSTDSDGSSQTMDITNLEMARYQVNVNDDAATTCAGTASTMTGTGQLEGAGLVVAAPSLTCDDGSTPTTTDGSSVEEALRNYTLLHDAATDTAMDSFGIPWQRRPAAPVDDSTEPGDSGPMWPQSTLNEVREAQERADAGDTATIWQVEPAMGEVGGDAEIFTRFLTEELGWEAFHWGAKAPWSASMYREISDGLARFDFIRCTTREPNPIYQDDPEGRRCAPTGGEYAYDTVRVTAYQPLGASPDGVWVIQDSQPQPQFHQVDPLTGDEIARGVEPFLQARVDGKGASGWAGNFPLIYATSDGKRYERFDYEVVDGPRWPYGDVALTVRLFADGGATVVEQPFSLELDFSSVVTPAPPQRLTMLNYDRGNRPTTQNGTNVPEPHELFRGRVRFAADWTWAGDVVGPHGPDTIALYRGESQDHVFAAVGTPFTPTEGCEVGNQPQSVEQLVRNLRSVRNLSVSPPRPAHVGQFDAVQLDVIARESDSGCVVAPGAPEQPFEGSAVIAPLADHNHPKLRLWWGLGPDAKARLYAFDLPGKKARTIVILIMAPEDAFEAVLDDVGPILDSFEAR